MFKRRVGSSVRSGLVVPRRGFVIDPSFGDRYNAPQVRTSVICPTKVSTQMGDAMKEQDNQLYVPSLAF